jgi:hypothetical protein
MILALAVLQTACVMIGTAVPKPVGVPPWLVVLGGFGALRRLPTREEPRRFVSRRH